MSASTIARWNAISLSRTDDPSLKVLILYRTNPGQCHCPLFPLLTFTSVQDHRMGRIKMTTTTLYRLSRVHLLQILWMLTKITFTSTMSMFEAQLARLSPSRQGSNPIIRALPCLQSWVGLRDNPLGYLRTVGRPSPHVNVW